MTQPTLAYSTSPPPPGLPRLLPLTALIAGILLALFLLQLPTSQVGDWQQFAFYDPGTVLKGDMLLQKGYVPTIDFGYTHGLLSLLFARAGFALLGRSALTFWILTLLCELGIAWGFARMVRALRLSRPAIALLLIGLPMAVMPAYLTLTHPLEALFIVLALAAQSEGKRGQALTLLTVCLFVKPSMAYVYGALLLVIMAGEAARNRRWRDLTRGLFGAAVMAALLLAILTAWIGLRPVENTLLPLTGAKTYAATGFGFFNTSGLALWWKQPWYVYIGTPVGMVLLAALTGAAGALYAIGRNLTARRPIARPATWEILATVGLLQTAFLLGFYGWTGSWTYYSYLGVWALVLAADELQARLHRRWPAITLCVLLALSHTTILVLAFHGWMYKERPRDTGGLWVYSDLWAAWNGTLAQVGDGPTILMTNGWVPHLPANIEMPDAWFPEPGIPTGREVARVKAQIARCQNVIVWFEYRRFDLWNSPDLAPERAQFEERYKNDFFTLLSRKDSRP